MRRPPSGAAHRAKQSQSDDRARRGPARRRRRRWDRLYKQSQFAPRQEEKTIAKAFGLDAAPARRVGAPNKANLATGLGEGPQGAGGPVRPVVQTKPIFRGPGLARLVGTPNCAKQSQSAASILRNKANFPGRPGSGAARGPIVPNKAKPGQDGTSGGQRPARATCAKQTQFADCGLGTGLQPDAPAASRPASAGRLYKQTQFTGANRAKQTQLPEAGHRGGVGELAGRRNPHHSTIPSFQHSSFVVYPSQQWGCWHIDGVRPGSILSGDSIR